MYSCFNKSLLFYLDPEVELKVTKDKLKESEKTCDLLRNECIRLNSEVNELNEKVQAIEIQLESQTSDLKKQLNHKEVGKTT